MTTKICLLAILAFAAAGVGCSTNQATDNNANAAQTTAQATTSPAPDNSEITTSVDAQGNRTETRVFRDNPRVAKVVVTTNKNGTKSTRVISRSGEEREVKTNENVLEATGDKVADAAGFVAAEGEKAANEVGDKAEDVKDKTVSTSKKVGSTVADKADDAKDTTVSTTKKVGSTVGDKAEDVGDKTVSTTKKAGKKVGHAVKKVIP